ncbi:pseudouridine synthase [Niveomyces insectorum RCEF 264]|uniref:Pseudouridine synthase n=1 Tax=Niveomyces insectorum RCEF 264 TaxID=1081102 RepID=A0A167Q6V3_9HYPO|nr:pseudouridine synthase [Niveomyces insectorum RCEF 264]
MANLTGLPSGNHLPEVRASSEKKLGILHFTSNVDFAWSGEIRKRYTDFIVHEVRKDGSVIYLMDANLNDSQKRNEPAASKPATNQTQKAAVASPESSTKPAEAAQVDVAALHALVGQAVADEMLATYAAMTGGGPVSKCQITIATSLERSQRGFVHQEIRRIFSGRFETRADGDTGVIVATPAAAGGGKARNQGRNSSSAHWRDNRDGSGGGASPQKPPSKYLHFTLFKENKDTMEAINHLARLLKVKASNFGFSGTKDRRAATTQRMSVLLNGNQDIGWVNARISNIRVGDFSRHAKPIQLGQHGGNDFVIVAKNVQLVRGTGCSLYHRLRMTETCVQASLDHIQKHGFINYFGLQRFGTHAIGTQEIGLKILSGDFEAACDFILHVEPDLLASLHDPDVETRYQRDEIARARAIAMFRESPGEAEAALSILPRRFSAEGTILQHLGRRYESRRDFCGALLKITRGLRNLYIHAYQSFVWNWAASLRWSKYGNRVVAGDLVLVLSESNPARFPQGPEMSENVSQNEEVFYQQARPLSEHEVNTGDYTIFDVVLPAPGYDVLYPDNEIGEFYKEFMGREENGRLDPYRMRRPQKEFSLSGHYRKIMARFTAVPKFFVRPYTDDAEQMHPTDLDDIRAIMEEEAKKKKEEEDQKEAQAADATMIAGNDTTGEATTSSRRRQISPGDNAAEPGARDNDAWVESAADGGSKRVKLEPFPALSMRDEINIAFATPSDVAVNTPFVDSAPACAAPAVPMQTPEELAARDRATRDEVNRLFARDGMEDAVPPAPSPSDSKLGRAAPYYKLSEPPRRARSPDEIEAAAALPPLTNLFREDLDGKTETTTTKKSNDTGCFNPETGTAYADGLQNDGRPAVNVTDAWRRSAPLFDYSDPASLNIAVVLNFQLSSSNYATMCLREMMSNAYGFAAETAPVTDAGDGNAGKK